MLIRPTKTDLPDLGRLARSMRTQAKSGTWDGRAPTPYFHGCRWVLPAIGCVAHLTRDVGGHSGGWWKNPDYERCWHLSLSFRDLQTGEPAPRNRTLTGLLLEAVYGPDKRLLWCEPPNSPAGKQLDVWHYRLFVDAHWQAIHPRGEVYGRELTEAGWRSYSDVQADLQAIADRQAEST